MKTSARCAHGRFSMQRSSFHGAGDRTHSVWCKVKRAGPEMQRIGIGVNGARSDRLIVEGRVWTVECIHAAYRTVGPAELRVATARGRE